MREPYREVTFRRGRPVAGYYHLSRESGAVAARSEPVEPSLVVDHAEDGRPLGIEIVAPSLVTVDAFNAVLHGLGLQGVGAEELAPLHAA